MIFWSSWSDFFAMGGYALYVWGSLAVVFGAIAIELVLVEQRSKAAIEQLAAAQRRSGGQR
jgi:heme exporter protein D